MLPRLHIARQLTTWLGFAMGYAAAVSLVVHLLELPRWPAGREVAGILGVALGWLVVFRNNAANDRWWEARKLWGQLINEVRNLALKARTYADVDDAERHRFAHLLRGFPHALRLQLRGNGGDIRLVPGFQDDRSDFPHVPGDLAGRIHATLARWDAAGKLGHALWLLDVHARALLDVCGGCERIASTPLASSYRSMFRSAITLYVLIAPWALSLEVGWWDLPPLAIGFGFLIGVELTAEAIEEPFGRDGDDLPLESYCRTIETFVTAALEGPELPG